MDLNTMSFGELLYHGRYHFIMALLFLVFLGAFIVEIVRELRTSKNKAASPNKVMDFVYRDAVLGATMMDGGEQVEHDQDPKKSPNAR